MRALITGVTGFAGKHLAELISGKKGVELYGLRRPSSKNSAPRSAKVCDCDVRDEKKLGVLLKKIKPSHIFHLAAIASVSRSWLEPQLTFQNNVEGTRSLLEAVRRFCPRARVLVASSAEVYGSCRGSIQKFDESSPLRPLNPYAVSKIAQEFTAYQYFLNHGLRVVLTRAFNHIGPGQSDAYAVSSFAKQVALIEARRQKAVIAVGNLETVRDFTDVRDVAEAYWRCLEKGAPGDVYNVSSGHGHKIGEVLRFYLNRSAVKIKIKKNSGRLRALDSSVLIGDSRKLRRKTGWRQTFSFEQTLSDILNDWRKKINAKSKI